MRYRLIAALFAVVEVCACNNIDFNTLLLNENSSSTAKLNACMLNEINSQAANGTLFTSGFGVKATAEDVANDCIRKLTLQSMGLNETAVNNATNFINSIKNAAQN